MQSFLGSFWLNGGSRKSLMDRESGAAHWMEISSSIYHTSTTNPCIGNRIDLDFFCWWRLVSLRELHSGVLWNLLISFISLKLFWSTAFSTSSWPTVFAIYLLEKMSRAVWFSNEMTVKKHRKRHKWTERYLQAFRSYDGWFWLQVRQFYAKHTLRLLIDD